MTYKSGEETVYRWGARMKACITSTYPGSGDELEQLLTYLSKRDIYKVNVEASTLLDIYARDNGITRQDVIDLLKRMSSSIHPAASPLSIITSS